MPVNADVQQVSIIMLSEIDPEMHPAGFKGIGELSNWGPTPPSPER